MAGSFMNQSGPSTSGQLPGWAESERSCIYWRIVKSEFLQKRIWHGNAQNSKAGFRFRNPALLYINFFNLSADLRRTPGMSKGAVPQQSRWRQCVQHSFCVPDVQGIFYLPFLILPTQWWGYYNTGFSKQVLLFFEIMPEVPWWRHKPTFRLTGQGFPLISTFGEFILFGHS